MTVCTVRRHIEAQAAALMAKHHAVFLGGDHSVTLSLLRAAQAHHGGGEPLALVHFDAHCDTWSDHFGEPSGHGTWTYEALQEGLVSAAHTVQIGIRSSGERAAREYAEEYAALCVEESVKRCAKLCRVHGETFLPSRRI